MRRTQTPVLQGIPVRRGDGSETADSVGGDGVAGWGAFHSQHEGLLEVGCLGRGEDRRGEDDRHEDQELLRAGGRQLERGRNRTAHGIGERRRRGREAAESGGDGQEGG